MKKYQRKTYTEFYVYELLDDNNELLYIGQTAVPEKRSKSHYYNKGGLFYKRKDIRLNVIETYSTRREAKQREHELQKYYWPLVETDFEKNLKGCKRGGENPQREGRVKGGAIGGKKGGVTSTHRLFYMSCGREIKTHGAMMYHKKVCGCDVNYWRQLA
jgi:predicted GIY-YIG superfamily endonuclease